jgi:alpha-2-macroglobulin
MKLPTMVALGSLLALGTFAALPPDYEKLKADAEKFQAEGSFARANELYSSVNLTNLPAADQRWVEFRRADTQWRSQAATQTADTTRLDAARDQLEKLVREAQRNEDKDRVWVEAQESLGDFHWTRRNQQNWGAAWPRYQQALEWWAGAADIETARQRYLAMVWRIVQPPGRERGGYGYWGNYVPLEVLENVLKIAQTDNDKAQAHFLIAMTIRNQGGQWEQRARVPEEFEAALKAGRSTEWYDDALYSYAEWMAGQGHIMPLENGSWRSEPDYPKALELFRRLVNEFQKGESRYWEQAQQQIKNITEPQLGVSVPNIFLPDSEIQYHLTWRNVKQIELALYPVELNRDVKLPPEDVNAPNWLWSIDLAGREKIKSWTHDARSDNKGRAELPLGPDARQRVPAEDYRPGNETLQLDQKLKPGAYVLEATGGGQSARDLVLVTDAALVLKTSGNQALVYCCNALDSSPIAGAKVTLWESWSQNDGWHSRVMEQMADTNGLTVFEMKILPNQTREMFVGAIRDDRQAFTAGSCYWRIQPGSGVQVGIDPATGWLGTRKHLEWRIYAFTDRPAYRPGETVNWKFIGRRYDGSVYSTPSDQLVEFEITDPRGTKVKADKAALNAFGSAWGSLDVTGQLPLGEYRITFWDENRRQEIGQATLFRLEEYKLPEFKVTVTTPEEDGRKKAFRLGEKVEVTIQADYYFGGPVADASVELLVHQNPYWHWWHEPRPFPWFYEDMGSSYGRWYGGGGGQIVKRETLKTDAAGQATLTFETPANAGQDFEYRVEARVTDSSRREIIGNGTVRVTRQRYYVYAQPTHNLYRPQDKVEVKFKALDANEQPIQSEGAVKVTRDYWFEIWLAPDGREVKGDELKQLQAGATIWPPPPARPDQKDWRLKFRGYEHDDILTRSLKTDTNGEAQLTFTPEREGYYRIAWTSDDSSSIQHPVSSIQYPPSSIQTDTTIWVCSGKTTDLGYRHGGVEIIADKDTFHVGQKAPVMFVANSPDRYVLFSVEGDDLYSYQLVHLEGTVKLIELAVEEKHVPNVFLGAAMVSDRQLFTDTKQIVVPPTKNFLTVNVKPDREQYQPRDEGTLLVTTKNDEGKPVSAEVALGLVDESVFYIQSDYAGDPRQFYFGTKRGQRIQTQATMNQRSYAKLVRWENDQVIDERDKEQVLEQRLRLEGVSQLETMTENDRGFGGGGGGSGGGRVGRMVMTKSIGGLARGAALSPIPSASPVVALGDKGIFAMSAEMRPGQEPVVVVRSDFRSTVFWQPDVVTDKDGKATVKVKYPDSTTSWKATARAATAGNQFGIADATTRTKQPLIVRLQAPRFFLVGDTVTISAVVNNNTDQPMEVKVALDLTGGVEVGRAVPSAPPSDTQKRRGAETAPYPQTVKVPPSGEARVDWIVQVKSPGDVKLKVTGRGGKYADAMEKTYLAYEHGIEKFIAKSGKARGTDLTVKLDLPKERRAGSTTLTVQVTPSLAVTMLDALPYLIDYSYGCTEQTMSRFLPAAITAKTLRDLGLQPEDVMSRVFGGIETNSAAATHPKGKHDLAELDAMVKAGLERLYDFQHGDGGWGWWKQGESDHWMTAYVVWGLSLARDAGTGVKADALKRGAEFLDKTLVEEEANPDMQAFMLHAGAAFRGSQKATKLTKFQQKAFDNLWRHREKLNAYTRSLLALTAHAAGKTNEARILVENLENGVKRDERPDASVLIAGTNLQPSTMGTAHWGEDGVCWRWSDGGVEATAFALRALLAIDPHNKLIEPVTNWLIKNRRGAQWNSTRDTAIVLLALNDYLRTSGELKGEVEYDLYVNGSAVAHKKISGADVFAAPSRFAIDMRLIRDSNEIRVKARSLGRAARPGEASRADGSPRAEGEPSLYFAAEAKFFSTEEPITPAGNEIFVRREYFKLVGRPTLLKGHVYDREPLLDGGTVKSGERVQTVITIEGKNNYEYLLFEDLKPAGLEAVEIRSGESLYANELKRVAVGKAASTSGKSRAGVRGPRSLVQSATDYTGRTRWVYQELRDRKVAFFIDKLPQGLWEIRYDLRAEVPGRFHALPVLGQAMYVPEIRGNGAEIRINVLDAN